MRFRHIVSELFYLTNKFLMWIPITCIRKLWIYIIGCNIGKNVYIARCVEIRKPKNIIIGDGSIINSKVLLDGRGGLLSIGKNVDIAQEVIIWTESHDPHSDYHVTLDAPVTIEDYAWIGCRSMIMPGLIIGRGSVVAACSVVTKNVEEMAIVAGVPAKKKGLRRSKLKYKFCFKNYFK